VKKPAGPMQAGDNGAKESSGSAQASDNGGALFRKALASRPRPQLHVNLRFPTF